MNGPSALAAHYPTVGTGQAVRAAPWLLAAMIGLAVGGAFWVCLLDPDVVNWGGWTIAWRFVQGAFAPAHDLAILQLAATCILTTAAYALCGSAVSVCLGAVGGVLASETWWQLWFARSEGTSSPWAQPAKLVRALIAIPRGIHEIVWGLLFVNVLGLDPLVAILAIGIPFGAITAKVFAEIIDDSSKESAFRFRSAGASAAVAFAYGVWPRVFPLLLSYALYRLECAIRSAAVLGLIGAGGLGYQIMLSLQSLRCNQVWTFLYALMGLVALTDWGSSRLTSTLRAQSASTSSEMARQTRSAALAIILVGASLVLAALHLSLDLGKLIEPRRIELLGDVMASAMPPRLQPGDIRELGLLSLETLAMSIAAIAIAGPAAIVASWFSSMSLFELAAGAGRRSHDAGHLMMRVLTTATRIVLIGVRAFSDGIWVLLALSLFFPGAFAGAFALAAYNFGVMGRLLSQINDNADKQPFRALRAQGASFGRAILYGLVPGTLPKYLAYVLYRWEVCVRATVVVGIVGAGGLGRRLEEQLASFDYRGVVTTLAFFVALTVVVDASSRAGRLALRTA